jgi:very-short-patch-repair endonuclease
MRQELIPGAIAALAGRQHGVVSSAQLRRIGLSDSAISRRTRVGSLHRLHTGVYAVGHTALGPRGRWMAAVLACGPAAALSHHAAGALWEMRPTAFALVDVTVPRTGARSRPGLRIHRPRTLSDDEVTSRHGIPVTTPARTVLDLAASLSERELQRVLDEAQVRRLATAPSLVALAAAHPGHRGTGALGRALRDHTPGTTLTRSELEERFLALCRTHGLPQPEVNVRVAGLEVDFVFARHRVAVETDGWRFHGHRAAFERDRRRDAALTRAGYRTLRFTHDQVADEPRVIAATVAAALAHDRAA